MRKNAWSGKIAVRASFIKISIQDIYSRILKTFSNLKCLQVKGSSRVKSLLLALREFENRILKIRTSRQPSNR